ncbi:MAG: hypothetical protein HY457_03425 [Parcubacteria group bacterium]|nr:hypothetical protein [Parcubacteria group bacterium]
MLTPADKKWIEEKLAKEGKPVRDSIDLLRGKMTTMNFEKFNFDSRLDSIEASNIRTEEKIDKVLTVLDGFAGKVATIDQENKMGSVTLRRHDIQIHELAAATGTTISE